MSRVEYTLSFENYLEMTKGRRNPRMRGAITAAATGFGFLVLGYTWLRLMPESWSVVGGSFLGLGLLATVLSFLLGLWEKPRGSHTDAATLRSEYQHYHSDKRAIEFDENGWRLFWYEGEDVRPWSCLRAFHDQKTILVLATETTYYWLPKAALQRENQLEGITALAENALDNHRKLFSVPLRPSVFVYIAAWMAHNWRRQYRGMLLGCAVLTLFLYWIFFPNGAEESRHSPWLVALAPPLLLFLEVLYYLRNFYFAKWADTAHDVEIMSDCIAYRTAAVRYLAPYRRLTGYHEFHWGFHLYFDTKNFHLIPKKHFSPDQLAQFRKLISARE